MSAVAGPASRSGEASGPYDRDAALMARYDALVFDLDGVLHRGCEPIPAAPTVIEWARSAAIPLVFLTNNSGRTPVQVAGRLASMGLDVRADEVLTSALATAAMLEAEGAGGTTAFLIGGDGIRDALASVGIGVLEGEPARADLVVVGWDPEVDYAALRTASLLVEAGARLIATNRDASFPAADGLWPGAGALLAVITTTTGATPVVVGKPSLPMFEQAAKLAGVERILMIGDRLDTDIAGAAGAGWDSLLVLSGVSRALDLPGARALPTYVAPDVGALLAPRVPARIRGAPEDDAGAIEALLSDSGLEPDGLDARLAGTMLAREPDGRLAATATCQRIGGVNYLRAVAVREDLRREGLGILITAAAVRSGDPGAPTYLATDGAAPLFQRLGFERIAQEDVPRPVIDIMTGQGCGATATVMRLAPLGGRGNDGIA